MNSKFTTDFNKPTIFTAQSYGTKTTVEIDHSDLNLDEVMDAFQTLIIGMGYSADSLKRWVTERAVEYNETDAEDLKEKLEAWKFEDDDTVIRHRDENGEELENDFFGSWDMPMKKGTEEEPMSQLQYNLNRDKMVEATYKVTKEDKDGISNDGGFDGKPHFEWGDVPEDDEDLFEGDAWVANQKLVEANERYKKEVKKKKNSKKKNIKK